MYADDLILISSSVCALQKMIDTCLSCATELCLNFNVKKSQCIQIGPRHINVAKMYLYDMPVEWTETMNYLGLVIKSAKCFTVDTGSVKRKFFLSANSVIGNAKHMNEPVKLQLIESYCLPSLMYNLACINLSKNELNQLNVCWNSAYRKIFGMRWGESISDIMYHMGRMDYKCNYMYRKFNFVKSCWTNNDNVPLHSIMCIYLHGNEYRNLCKSADVNGILCSKMVLHAAVQATFVKSKNITVV